MASGQVQLASWRPNFAARARRVRSLALPDAGASGVIGRPLVRQLLAAGHEVPGWLELNPAELAVRIVAAPTQDQIPFDVNPNLIVEFYR